MLRTERKRLRLTLADVAAAAGCSLGHVSDVERGVRRPGAANAHALACAVGGWTDAMVAALADERGSVAEQAVVAIGANPYIPRSAHDLACDLAAIMRERSESMLPLAQIRRARRLWLEESEARRAALRRARGETP